MLEFKSLTNVRPTKDLGCEIICAPTEGQFKVTPEAADVLGVKSGDYLQLVEAGDTFYAVKGGEINGTTLGGKLASSNKTGGGILTISAAAAWDEMGGSSEINKHYSINAEEAVEQDERVYFPLTFVEDKPKQVRKKKGENTDEVEKTAETTETTETTEGTFEDI